MQWVHLESPSVELQTFCYHLLLHLLGSISKIIKMYKAFVVLCFIAAAFAMPQPIGYESGIPVVTKTVYHQPGTLVHHSGIPTVVKSYSSPTLVKSYSSPTLVKSYSSPTVIKSYSAPVATVVRSHPTLSEW